MSDRGFELMTKALDQVDEAAQALEESTETHLRQPYKETADGHAATTVGGAAIHFAQGYGKLGKFLAESGYIPAQDPFGSGGGSGSHGHGGHGGGGGHGHGGGHGFGGLEASLTVPDVIKSLDRARAIIDLFEELGDEQLDSVPSIIGEWADGERTLYAVIDTLIDHQSEHLADLKAALS
jgi:hypothetical protein